jgi:hypothetical protein
VTLEAQIRYTLDRIRARERVQSERIAALRAEYASHVLNEVITTRFKRMILALRPVSGPCWAGLHSRVGSHMPRVPVWFRAHEGTYPCVHAGVLIGFCSPEYAAAFESLVTDGHLTVEINPNDVDRWGVPSATVRGC